MLLDRAGVGDGIRSSGSLQSVQSDATGCGRAARGVCGGGSWLPAARTGWRQAGDRGVIFATWTSLQTPATLQTGVVRPRRACVVSFCRLKSSLLSCVVPSSRQAKSIRDDPTAASSPRPDLSTSSTLCTPHHSTRPRPPRVSQPCLCLSKPSSLTGSCSACVPTPIGRPRPG